MSKAKNKGGGWKFWGIAIGAIVLTYLGIYTLVTSGNGNTGGNIDLPETLQQEWVKGDPNAKVVLVEYSDFQCPACAYYHGMLKSVIPEFSNHIAFIYRHFPLSQHDNALITAYAAEAAGIQGKFYEMHDLIFAGQGEWSNMSNSQAEAKMIEYAEQLSLDVDKFKSDISSKEVEAAVKQDLQSANEAGVNSTPSFYLNGQKITNPSNNEAFREIIRNAVKEAEQQS